MLSCTKKDHLIYCKMFVFYGISDGLIGKLMSICILVIIINSLYYAGP